VEPATTDLTVSLVEHTNFAVSDRAGDMLPGTYHGFFVADTRFLSRLVLRVSGRRLEPLASGGDPHHGAGTFYLASPRLPRIPPATISVFRDRRLTTALHERIRLISYAMEPIEVEVSLELDADFADIFEVRGHRRMRRSIDGRPRHRGREFSYEHQGHRRTTVVRVDRTPADKDGRMSFRATLRHGQPWDLNLAVEPELTHRRGTEPPPPRRIDPELVRAWQERAPRLSTSDPRLQRAWRRGIRDMASLLLTGPAGRFIPAAGLPWFLAIFGRDSAITAMQSLLLGPDIAHGTLRQLAIYQGRTLDPWREEEPGKIPHEVRTGELAVLGHLPFGRYYGAVDATPLYVMLFIATCRWSGWLRDGGSKRARTMTPPLSEFLVHVEAAMDWIERRVDPDGLLWYRPWPRGGIRNQVWKDSDDSMRYADGSIAAPPIAAVEVQGYVVAARRGMAEVYASLGRDGEAATQRSAAERLAAVIDDRFWMPNEGTYALGLDGRGLQIDSVTSNPGHLLWADCVPPQRTASVTERLMAPDMYTGWGIRTLSSRNPGYNPIGYHIGSVWPHDNSLIANGMARAEHVAAAQRVIDGLLDAVEAAPDHRLPELFAGFDRVSTPDLVPYPTACAPQAWATGAIFQSVRTLLGIPSAERSEAWRALELDSTHDEAWTLAELRSSLERG
jgi:glycogen debranching enzyme